MNIRNKIGLMGLLVFSGISVQALADICTPPPGSVKPNLSVQVSYDKKTQLYKYKYTMRNASDARIPIDYFGLLINQAPSLSLSGANWGGKFLSTGRSPSNFRWTTTVVEDPNKVTGDGTLSLPIYAIKPGKSLGGFEISSAQPPGTVQFFAEGFTQPPTGTPTADNDEPIPDCPGWDFESSKLQTQVTGMTVGPSDPSVISVRIRAREEKGLRSCDPIKPKSPSGKISVLVFSTQFFDASKIDIKNVFFGPGYAIPTASKLVPVGQGEQGDSDERAEWERSNDNLKLEDLDRKKVKFQNMLLTFDVATLDVQCNLDQALFLRGKTISGQQFIGGVKAEIAGCDSKDLGKHKNHQPPFKWWVK